MGSHLSEKSGSLIRERTWPDIAELGPLIAIPQMAGFRNETCSQPAKPTRQVAKTLATLITNVT